MTSFVRKEPERVNSNNKYPNFFQNIFHAGDIKQFLEHSGLTVDDPEFETFLYLFDVLKKGVYVQIQDNKLKVFLPFSNANYRNDWGKLLRTKDSDYKKVVELEKRKHRNHDPEEYRTKIADDPTMWYANYNMFRNTVYENGDLKDLMDEGDKSIDNFYVLFTELCQKRKIKDTKIFLNPRDYPVLRKDFTHPYDILYQGKVPACPELERLKQNGHAKIFSQSTSDLYQDILMPDDDDIVRIIVNKVRKRYNINWESKKDVAIFRGSATGSGINENSNARLRLIKFAENNKDLNIDAKLTGFNNRLKLDPVLGYCDYIDTRRFQGGKKADFMTQEEQSNYKYIIHVEGHVAAFRLANEMAYSSLILKVDSKWKTWYSDFLLGYDPEKDLDDDIDFNDYHYISIKSDLSNLRDILGWCKKNDQKCKIIARNAFNFYKDHLENEKFMLNYMKYQLDR